MLGKRHPRNVIPSEVEGSFSLAVRGRVSDSEKRETPYREKVGAVLPVNGLAKEEGKRGRKRFLAALEMTVWGMGLFHVAYNGYVWKVLFLYRHPERSRGIFLAYWYSVLCETAEKGKTFAKGARNDGVQGRFLATLEMTVWCISPYVR